MHMANDFPPVTNAGYEAADGGTRLYKEIDLPFTTNARMAQRIAKIHLERARQAIVCKFPAKLGALELTTWDTVRLDIAQLGWSAKVFRILEWALTEDCGVDLTLQEEAAAIYSWSLEETVGDLAPNTGLPNPFTVQPPGAPEVTEGLYVTRDGSGVKAFVDLSWQESPDEYVQSGGHYQVEYRRTSAPA